jgi:predicted O-methyltransferase YrrM
MQPKRILLFAPYGLWKVHHQVDAVIGMALQERGCEVKIVCCDGIFELCPVAGNPHNSATCELCARSEKTFFRQFGLPIIQLRDLLEPGDLAHNKQWAATLSPDEIQNAVFDGDNLSNWVYANLFPYQFRGILDYADPETDRVYRTYLYNGAILKTALERFLDSFQPDQVLCFNGVMLQYRVALELCRKRHIPILTHDRGFNDDSFQIHENENINGSAGRKRAWQSWKNAPLNQAECQAVNRYLFDREIGKNTNFTAFYDFRTEATRIRKTLRIPANARIVAFFTSSDWEVGQKERDIESSFKNEIDAINKVIDIFRGRPEYLVIRHHPNVVGKDHTGRYFLSELFKINSDLPANVRVLMPTEKVTSYAICWNSDALLTYGSTTGIESMARGLVGLSMFNNLYCNVEMGLRYIGSGDIEAAIEESLERTRAFGLEDLRSIYRGTYFLFMRLSYRFKAFGFSDPFTPEFRFQSRDDLLPGNDPVLDQVCDHVMHGSPLYPMPSEEQLNHSNAQETAFLEQELEKIKLTRAGLKRQAIIDGDVGEPKLSVVRIRQNGLQNVEGTYLDRSLGHSRHKEIERLEMAYPNDFTPQDFLEELAISGESAGGQYIYFAADAVHTDEALFSHAIDFMESKPEAGAILSGAWLTDGAGNVVGELFTGRKFVDDYKTDCQQFPLLQDPVYLLSLIVWQKAAFGRFVENLKQSSFETFEGLAQLVFEKALDESILKSTRSLIPNIVFYPPETAASLAARGIRHLKANRWEEAHRYFELASCYDTEVPDLRLCRIMTKARTARLWQAVAVAESHPTGHPEDPQVLRLSNEFKAALSGRQPRYQDCVEVIEATEGWLVPGQEQFLFEKARSLRGNATILEIGSCFGRSTVALGYGCLRSDKKVFAIDTFMGNVSGGTRRRGLTFFDVWRTNIRRAGLEHIVTPLRGFSHEVLQTWGDRPKLDFVFIDASHHYADIMKELELVYPLVNDGGWIAFHDVEPAWPGPWRIWHETATALLDDHEICSTLACGRKVGGRPFLRPAVAVHFSYAQSWAKYLSGLNRPLSDAMKRTLGGELTDDEWEKAEAIIAEMSGHPAFRFSLQEMLKLEAGEDPYLHYWFALTLDRCEDKAAAAIAFDKALELSNPALHKRLLFHIDKLKAIDAPVAI